MERERAGEGAAGVEGAAEGEGAAEVDGAAGVERTVDGEGIGRRDDSSDSEPSAATITTMATSTPPARRL